VGTLRVPQAESRAFADQDATLDGSPVRLHPGQPDTVLVMLRMNLSFDVPRPSWVKIRRRWQLTNEIRVP